MVENTINTAVVASCPAQQPARTALLFAVVCLLMAGRALGTTPTATPEENVADTTDPASSTADDPKGCPMPAESQKKSQGLGAAIVIDLDGDGFAFSGTEDAVFFDLDSDGAAESTAWTGVQEFDGFLAIDINQDGWIDRGSELFGDRSFLLDGRAAPNGFAALAVYDGARSGGDEDCTIDPDDMAFQALRVWFDTNQSGIVDEGELLSLQEVSITRIELGYESNETEDEFGNRTRFVGTAWVRLDEDEVPRKMIDVVFAGTDL